jgi:hypothetical protein
MASKYRIDLGTSNFREFIEKGNLYIDKTLFIEHIIDNPSKVLLFTRPRRMGKTLNIDTLRTFLDPQVTDAKELFKGLNIEKSHVYEKMGSHPVIWLSFRDLKYGACRAQFLYKIKDIAKLYLEEDEISEELRFSLDLNSPMLLDSVAILSKNIYEVTGKRSYVIIDEYDKLVMDSVNIGKDAVQEAVDFTKGLMGPALKDNPHLEKGVITGVNRITQESMFSDLNNIVVDGVFQASEFDTDFGFIEEEVSKLIETKQDFEKVTNWYNGYRVGNEKVYFAYSVMSYLQYGVFSNYWGKSGVMDMIINHLTTDRIEAITKTISNGGVVESVEDRISIEGLFERNRADAFYSLLVQTGYFTHDKVGDKNDPFYDMSNNYLLNCPNIELQKVWETFILSNMYSIPEYNIFQAFNYGDNLAIFQGRFQELLTNKLSYFDFEKKEPEKTYHVYVIGLLAAAGYKPKSNKESGLGRYDIFVEVNDKAYIFEFKQTKDPEKIEEAAAVAIQQIHDKKYYEEIKTDKPIILVGIGFCGKSNWVTAENLLY